MIPKFRAWDKEKNRMIYPSTLDVCFELDDDGINVLDVSGGYPDDHVFPRIDSVLMESTGFIDNNDTEVFEGDVINIHWFYADFDPVELGAFENEEYAERVIVKKEFGNFGFWWEEADSWVDLATLAMSARLDEESFEILGNIYENPELASLGIE